MNQRKFSRSTLLRAALPGAALVALAEALPAHAATRCERCNRKNKCANGLRCLADVQGVDRCFASGDTGYSCGGATATNTPVPSATNTPAPNPTPVPTATTTPSTGSYIMRIQDYTDVNHAVVQKQAEDYRVQLAPLGIQVVYEDMGALGINACRETDRPLAIRVCESNGDPDGGPLSGGGGGSWERGSDGRWYTHGYAGVYDWYSPFDAELHESIVCHELLHSLGVPDYESPEPSCHNGADASPTDLQIIRDHLPPL